MLLPDLANDYVEIFSKALTIQQHGKYWHHNLFVEKLLLPGLFLQQLQ